MPTLAFWRDVSLIVLCLEVFVIGLPFLILGAYLVRGLRLGQGWLARNLPLWQLKAVQVRDAVEHFSTASVAPVMALAAFGAAVASIARALLALTNSNGSK